MTNGAILSAIDTTLFGAQHPRPMGEINTEWFQDRLKAIKLSQRQLAKKIGIDAAAVSYTLNGKRKMTMDEAKKIADVLLVPVTEVMRQAGIEVTDDVRRVPIAGYVAPGCLVNLLPKGTHDMVNAPADVPAGSFALQTRWVNAPSDGWLSFISGVQEQPAECLDRMVVCALKDGRMLRGILRRGYKSGLYNIVLIPESSVLENQEVVWCARVMWIQPQ